MSCATFRNAVFLFIFALGTTACGGGGSGGSSSNGSSNPTADASAADHPTPDPDDRDNLLTITEDNQIDVLREAGRGVVGPLSGDGLHAFSAYSPPASIIAFTRGFGTLNMGYRLAPNSDFDALKDPTDASGQVQYHCSDDSGTYEYVVNDAFVTGHVSAGDRVTVEFDNCVFSGPSDDLLIGEDGNFEEAPVGSFTMSVLVDGETIAYDFDSWSQSYSEEADGNDASLDWNVDTLGRLEVSREDDVFPGEMSFKLAGSDALRIAYDVTATEADGSPFDFSPHRDANRTLTDMTEVRLKYAKPSSALEEVDIDVRYASFSDTFGGQFVKVETNETIELNSHDEITGGRITMTGDESSVEADFDACAENGEAVLTLTSDGQGTTTGDCVSVIAS